ncbi:MAG TPA: asparagine synthase-related protein, partial [Myxococcota bacterium]|nr:asparagine synthase-related protein [Myxococcota bacterium]
EPTWRQSAAATERANPDAIREALVASVRSHLMADVPHGVLLSGGLDSSLTAAVAAKLFGELHGASAVRELKAFSIGLMGSPDLAASRTVASSLGVAHEPVVYTVEEGIDALREAIWHTETFEVTTIRAAIPMMLLARHIRSSGVKMVLSGEGADELFGGYLYFRLAPSAAELHDELVRKLDQLHFYDCLRANKAMAAWGVEARVPFLDRDFVDLAMRIRPEDKQPTAERCEKHILREAFTGWLPHDMLWRRKEQFSDGVGLGWADALAAHAARQVSDRDLADARARFPVNTPTSKEGYLYRSIFEELFPLASAAGCVPQALYGACAT